MARWQIRWQGALLALLGPLAAAAAPPADGRWEGVIDVPSAPQPLVVDIVHDGAAMLGSVILPGRGVKGAPLRDLVLDAQAMRASLAAALPFPADAPPLLTLHETAPGSAVGTLSFAGLTAPVSLLRSGPAQVDRPPVNRPVSAELAGRWSGRYEIFGQPREVTLTLQGTQAEMVVVGSRTTHIVFDSVHQGEQFLTLSGNDYGIAFEGRWRTAGGPIEGLFLQGPLELPLSLARAPKGG